MTRMRSFLRKVHLWVGLAAGLFLISAGLSGSLLVFREEIDALLYPKLVRTSGDDARVPLERVMTAVRAAPGTAPPYSIRFPRVEDGVYEIWTRGEDGPRVYVDPQRGAVLGSVMPTETLTGFLFYWHSKLLAGRTGELIVGWAALFLLALFYHF